MSAFDLEAEVRDLAARRDIMNVCQSYMRGQDRMLPDLQLSAFHADGYMDSGLLQGSPAAFVEFAQGFLRELKASQHIIGQHQISIHADGETADGEVYFLAWHRMVEDGEDKDLVVGGRYIDRYERRDGEWRIAKRRELIDWARTDPVADGFMQAYAGQLVLGGRGEDDFSVTRNWPE